jgi:galactokinase
VNDVDPFLRRVHHELSASFAPDRTVHHAAAADPIDVIGGFSDYAGATVVSAVSDRVARVAVQPRDDGQIQVFSFDHYDAHRPFTLVAPVEAVQRATDAQLRAHFADANAAWAGIAVGVVRASIASGASVRGGVSIAIQSNATNPAATLAAVARSVEPLCSGTSLPFETWVDDVSRVSGEPLRLRDVLAAAHGQSGELVRVECQSCTLLEPISLPAGVGVANREVRFATSAWQERAAELRVAAAMAHRLILDKIRQMGLAAGRELVGDPMGGYLSNLPLNDYRRYFRPYLPETLKGGAFLIEHRRANDPEVQIHPDTHYPILSACDLHVFSANRVRSFLDCVRFARDTSDPAVREKELNKAGHLLYASHASLGSDAGLVCTDADAIVAQIRRHEHSGYYGASLTPTGVAVLQALSAEAIADI